MSVTSVSVYQDKVLYAKGGRLFMWTPSRTSELAFIDDVRNTVITSVSFNDYFIVVGTIDKDVLVYDLIEDYKYKLVGHTDTVKSVACYDHFILSGGLDKNVILWDTSSYSNESNDLFDETIFEDGTILTENNTNHSQEVTCVCFAFPYMISGSFDKFVIVWKMNDNEYEPKKLKHDKRVSSVSASEDIIVSGCFDNKVYVWNFDGVLKHTLTGHSQGVTSVSCLDNIIVSGSLDKTIRIWNAATGEYKQSIYGDTEKVNSVCIYKYDTAILIASGASDFYVTNLSASNSTQYSGTCSICWENLEDFNEGDHVVQLFCGHFFHIRCLNNWQQRQLRNHRPVNCPMCRKVSDILFPDGVYRLRF